MINESALRDVLLAVLEECKGLHDTLSIVMEEVAVLRETVRGLDPTFSDVFEKKRGEQSAAALRRLAGQYFDELIRRLKAGEVC